jgi:uncharacterized protein YbcI
LTSKPTWSNALGRSTTSAFFVVSDEAPSPPQRENPMDKSNSTTAREIAKAASAFVQRQTDRVPKSVTVVLSEDTLVITLRGALSPAEKALAQSPAGFAEVQELHRQLFSNSSDSLRQEIKRITGAEVREAATEVAPTTGTAVQVFTTGAIVQVFLLARCLPADAWSGNGPVGSITKSEVQPG